jgi:penicillin-binding protein 2
MAIGQGDLIVTPIQMAVSYAALVNGGVVWEPKLGMKITRKELEERTRTVHKFLDDGDACPSESGCAPASAQLKLDATEFGIIQQGLNGVISHGAGTANDAFAGYPGTTFPVAGKTGTAELGETNLSDAWFISYAPAFGPEYVLSVYVEKAGHGGETAAPIARDIWEGVAGIDNTADVSLGHDEST